MTHGVLLLAMMLALTGTPQTDDSALKPTITRATALLNGVFSPRGFFNITVRLYQHPEVEWAKVLSSG